MNTHATLLYFCSQSTIPKLYMFPFIIILQSSPYREPEPFKILIKCIWDQNAYYLFVCVHMLSNATEHTHAEVALESMMP